VTTTENTGRWFQRVVPVSSLVLALVALAALVFPGFRDQLELSASHRREPYTELYFARAADGTQVVCTTSGGFVRVGFEVRSHLSEARDLDFEVTSGGAHETGTLRVDPGQTVQVTRLLARSARPAYTVSVRLPAMDEELHAHCPGTRP
jgi:hypothetical protein